MMELALAEAAESILTFALRGRTLAQKHRVYIDRIGVGAVPENYEQRLIEMFPGA